MKAHAESFGEIGHMEFQYIPGATPLDPDEAAALVPVHITTQADLNAWEQANIVLGDRWDGMKMCFPQTEENTNSEAEENIQPPAKTDS